MKIPFNQPAIVGRELEYIEDSIRRGQLSGDGHYTKLCNQLIARNTGSIAALITHSCTAALEMSVILADIGHGDEVIMPSFTFVSTANAVALRGGIPVFVDIDPRTLNIDPDLAAAAVTPKTKAIIAVHYAGFPADMDRLASICRDKGLVLIEDAAQALDSTYKGRPCGSLGDMAAFSFHETKNIVSGEGGALTINRPDLIERAEIIREKGTNRSNFLRGQTDKYTWVDIGSSFLPGELVAAFLFAQLENSGNINQRRRELFDRYIAAFSELSASGRVALPLRPNDATGNGHMFYFLMKDLSDREAFIKHMQAHQVVTPFHYVPLHSSPAGQKLSRTFKDLTVTNDIAARLVRLPMYYALPEKIDSVIEHALDYFKT